MVRSVSAARVLGALELLRKLSADFKALTDDLRKDEAFIEKVAGHVAPLPVGTIVAWHPEHDVPEGWRPCDGDNGTPDLRDRFILGTVDVKRSGQEGGELTHSHTVEVYKTTSGPPKNDRDGTDNNDAAHLTHTHVGTATDTNHLPPFTRLIYIMKIQ